MFDDVLVHGVNVINVRALHSDYIKKIIIPQNVSKYIVNWLGDMVKNSPNTIEEILIADKNKSNFHEGLQLNINLGKKNFNLITNKTSNNLNKHNFIKTSECTTNYDLVNSKLHSQLNSFNTIPYDSNLQQQIINKQIQFQNKKDLLFHLINSNKFLAYDQNIRNFKLYILEKNILNFSTNKDTSDLKLWLLKYENLTKEVSNLLDVSPEISRKIIHLYSKINDDNKFLNFVISSQDIKLNLARVDLINKDQSVHNSRDYYSYLLKYFHLNKYFELDD